MEKNRLKNEAMREELGISRYLKKNWRWKIAIMIVLCFYHVVAYCISYLSQIVVSTLFQSFSNKFSVFKCSKCSL
jgi:hypothetical protein